MIEIEEEILMWEIVWIIAFKNNPNSCKQECNKTNSDGSHSFPFYDRIICEQSCDKHC